MSEVNSNQNYQDMLAAIEQFREQLDMIKTYCGCDDFTALYIFNLQQQIDKLKYKRERDLKHFDARLASLEQSNNSKSVTEDFAEFS